MNDTDDTQHPEDVEESSPATDKLGDIEDVPSWTEVYSLAQEILDAAVEAAIEEDKHFGDSAPPPDDEARPRKREWVNEHWGDLPERWKFFTERSVYMPASLATSFQSAKENIQWAQLSEVNTVISAVGHWAGLAKTSFQTNFLNPLVNQTVSCQQLLFDELTVAANSYEAVLRGLLKDAKELGDDTIKVLDSFADCTKDDANSQLTTAGIAVGILATVASGGTGLPLALGLIGGGISVGKAATTESNISQDTVEDVMNQLYKVIDDLMEDAKAEEEKIAAGLRTSVADVEKFLSSSEPLTKATLLPHEPTGDGVTNLTDGKIPTPDEFHPHD